MTKNENIVQVIEKGKKFDEQMRALEKQIDNILDENDELEDENDNLRELTSDGVDLAKGVHDLTKEREKLSIDLTDKSEAIQKLLEDNETLVGRVDMARDEAQNLVEFARNQRNIEGL
jgi:predicted RNase H-like nuclease (RuvC/YqgF family)